MTSLTVRLSRVLKLADLKLPKRPRAVLALGVLALAVAGCGRTTLTGVTQDQLSAGAEPYFNVGPVTYQVQISRALNPFDSEDVQYLAGVKGAQNLAPNQLWYGVFLWAKNQSGKLQRSVSRFELEDSSGRIYQPTPLNPSINPYAWTSQVLSQNEIQPALDTTAGDGPTGGEVILFKVDQSIYSNRPLTLLIFAPGSTKPSRVSLDL